MTCPVFPKDCPPRIFMAWQVMPCDFTKTHCDIEYKCSPFDYQIDRENGGLIKRDWLIHAVYLMFYTDKAKEGCDFQGVRHGAAADGFLPENLKWGNSLYKSEFKGMNNRQGLKLFETAIKQILTMGFQRLGLTLPFSVKAELYGSRLYDVAIEIGKEKLKLRTTSDFTDLTWQH